MSVSAFISRLDLKDLGGGLSSDDRCERAKGFAFFHQRIDPVAHRGIAWISQDAATAQSSRTELHPPLKPGHDLSAAQMSGNFAAKRVIRFSFDDSAILPRIQDAGNFLVTKLRSPQRNRVR